MSQPSAGLILFRRSADSFEVLLVHPGGPFWRNKDDGVWTFPRGTIEPQEEAFAAALREFTEETGLHSTEPYFDLGEIRHKSGKRIRAWAFEADCDPAQLQSNCFEMEWPPKSGRIQQFPEIDRAEFFALPEARRKMIPAEVPFLDRLAAVLAEAG